MFRKCFILFETCFYLSGKHIYVAIFLTLYHNMYEQQ